MYLYLFYKVLSHSKKPWGLAENKNGWTVDVSDGEMAQVGSFVPFVSSSQFGKFKGLALLYFAGVSMGRFIVDTHQYSFLS